MVNSIAAAHGFDNGRPISQVSVHALDGQPVQRRVIAPFAQQRPDGFAITQQPPYEVRSEVSARAGYQYHL
jgi:hypothetical protein